MAKKMAAATKKSVGKPNRKRSAVPKLTKRPEVAQENRATRPPAAPAIFYRLHALLETVRSIAVYEDHLCTLLHEVQTHGTVAPELTTDLHFLLDEMPAPATYLEQVEATRRTLPEPSVAKPHQIKRVPKKQR